MGQLAAEAEAEIRRHASETYPNECCGALIAAGEAIVEAFPLPNTTSAGARRRFLIGPEDYRLAEGRARERRGQLAGFYHSHPDHPARPSLHDLAQRNGRVGCSYSSPHSSKTVAPSSAPVQARSQIKEDRARLSACP